MSGKRLVLARRTRWQSVDRLGRSLPDLLAVMGELKAKGVDLYLNPAIARHQHTRGQRNVSDAWRVLRI